MPYKNSTKLVISPLDWLTLLIIAWLLWVTIETFVEIGRARPNRGELAGARDPRMNTGDLQSQRLLHKGEANARGSKTGGDRSKS